MAMLIAWHTVNAMRHPNGRTFSCGFLIVTPEITIRDRLRVLLPNDPESYFRHRELVPTGMIRDMERAKIVITNYHAFRLWNVLTSPRAPARLLRAGGARNWKPWKPKGR
ncbi:MAG: type III restriction enzyme res subunit [Rhodospirillaceae bacterium]|nr:MAG: type III restriction enzyme res subunit [Rhodospirillaceae bacterium]